MQLQNSQILSALMAIAVVATNAQHCQVSGFTNCTAAQVQKINNTVAGIDSSTSFDVPVNQTCYVTTYEDCKLAIDNYE
ncbi:hypothetical protein M409DRAFT_30301 [Zasmidium cellare ATCC 36951]|uniref:Uncharacterized protein n=1 Tax=Zasmidium cellare ATCC 36951 TaxID=1080233 RepID=A0A6A6BWH1_ZASCE|nr:uncharacterized protein M409DRAFT_30301 [Zasmidium cellare ATCC 36951]KAF2159161.1 hypothetical protein M409DRAFT_30301 [Zasmidium cellare ATCC 36951]